MAGAKAKTGRSEPVQLAFTLPGFQATPPDSTQRPTLLNDTKRGPTSFRILDLREVFEKGEKAKPLDLQQGGDPLRLAAGSQAIAGYGVPGLNVMSPSFDLHKRVIRHIGRIPEDPIVSGIFEMQEQILFVLSNGGEEAEG